MGHETQKETNPPIPGNNNIEKGVHLDLREETSRPGPSAIPEGRWTLDRRMPPGSRHIFRNSAPARTHLLRTRFPNQITPSDPPVVERGGSPAPRRVGRGRGLPPRHPRPLLLLRHVHHPHPGPATLPPRILEPRKKKRISNICSSFDLSDVIWGFISIGVATCTTHRRCCVNSEIPIKHGQ